uniref:Uncharacterized protein n=1 Tax=Timema cristinae TaxID=61476 RepID=A0A7R9H2B9_TIMCR|nr:unnamed protein product [Timema cristinae]
MKKDLSNVLGDRLEREWNRELEKSKHKTKEPNLLKAIGRVFVCDLIIQGFYNVFFFTFLRVIQPMIFGLLLRSLSSSNDLDRTEALSYNGLLVLVAIMSTASGAHTYHHALHAGLRIKVACSSLVYRKVLRLSTSILNESAMGMTMNLLSNDVSRFENAVLMLHTLWTSPICGLISLYLIWKETSFSGFIGFGVTMSFLPLLALCSRMGMKYRYQTTLRTDSRIKLMDEIICGIKVIKMYAWEKPYEALISIARRAEINYIIKGFYLRSITASSMNYLLRTSVYITIASMFYFGEEIPAHKIFTYYSLMNVAVFSLIYVFSQSISYVSDAVVSIRRLQDFLMQEEWSIYQPVATKESSTENNVSKQTIISLIGATASWNSGSPQNTLQNIDIQVEAGQLISVIGSVGSGKTSLLQVLLGELPLSKGTCFLKGKLSYACQDSWVFGSTIRQNIVFGSPFDQKRYDEVVAVCALLPDIEQFPQRDMTYIGERGITLSGGQKARINLARAIYKEADVYILDDPLSTVDTHVSKQLFEDCISSYLANKTRILVTHQLQYIKSSHNIILLKNGFIEMQGTFEYFQTCGVNYAQLLGVDLNNEPEETGEEEKENNESQNGPTEFMRALRKISKTSTSKHKLNRISCEWVENEEMSLSPPTDLKEGSSKGKITGSIYMQYLSSGSGYLVMIWMAITTLLLQFAISTTDYWMGYWVRQEELRDYRQMYDKMQNYTDNRSYILMDEETAESSYIMPANMCIYIYSALIISIYLFTIVHSVAFVSGVTRSNEALHNLMFKRVINTNPRFFDTNPSDSLLKMHFPDDINTGRILNRFSKDVGSMDEQLFKSLFDTIQLLRNNFGSLILIAVVSYTSLVPTIGLLIGFYFLRKFYLRSSKNLKRLDGITKSPVFTHLQTTLRGLSTIRAYGAQNILKAEFDNYQRWVLNDQSSHSWAVLPYSKLGDHLGPRAMIEQFGNEVTKKRSAISIMKAWMKLVLVQKDLQTSANFMFLSSGCAFIFYLDIMFLIYSTCVTYSFLIFGDALVTDVGLAITQVTALSMLCQWGMKQSTELSNNMMSVERILEYTRLEEEPLLASTPGKTPPEEWPKEDSRRKWLTMDRMQSDIITMLSLDTKDGKELQYRQSTPQPQDADSLAALLENTLSSTPAPPYCSSILPFGLFPRKTSELISSTTNTGGHNGSRVGLTVVLQKLPRQIRLSITLYLQLEYFVLPT